MKGKSRAMIEQIRQMRAANHSIKKISIALGLSRNTVRRYLRTKKAADSPQIHPASLPSWKPDWEVVATEYNRGRPLKRVFEDLAPSMSYSSFTRHFRKHASTTPRVAMRLNHEPGEKCQVDYADGIKITDRRTGEQTPTQFFCGVLPYSSYTFGEFSLSQKLPDFIRSHERMWAYFGGVTKYVVLDNLKSGVTKAHRYDPDLNPTYCDYGNHAGFAALPARVRTPRDKASVEAAIGVIQRDFFDRHRDTKFYSLAELNAAFRDYLNNLNSRTMADYGCSREDRFVNEKAKLSPSSREPYELYEWKTSKVHPDSCIELFKSVYSVPYRYVGRHVKVKYSDYLVIVIDDLTHEIISQHARQARFKHSIDENHFPPAKTQLKSFNVLRVQKFAARIGPHTSAYVDWQFRLEDPLRALRRMLGFMRLCDKSLLSREAIEHASKTAVLFQKKQLSYFENCAKSFSVHGRSLHLVTPPIRETAHIHLSPKE